MKNYTFPKMLPLFGIFVGDVDLRLEFAAIAGGIQMNAVKNNVWATR